MTELFRGAEASIESKDGIIVKNRLKKGYRIEALDEKIRKQRTQAESSALDFAKRIGIPVPSVLGAEKTTLKLEIIEGKRLKDSIPNSKDSNLKKIFTELGSYVGKMHSNGLIHGDLTTSNMILSDRLYLIDFGLSFFSKSLEDMAVDLLLLKKALRSTHLDKSEFLWDCVEKGYEEYPQCRDVFKKIKDIEKRGRYTEKD